MAQKKETKQINAINPEDVAKTIHTIVSLMEAVDASRDMISDKLKYLKETYGLPVADVRAAATALKKQNIDELDEKTKRIQELVDLCL
jgi:ribosomal protein L12E/L44/L45/RPP1/RPP2